MTLSSSIIKELREKSGAGMLDCKKALEESDGNIEKAIEWLRKKGINTAQKKSSREASDGLVTILTSEMTAIIMEINVETDFVAKNEIFSSFCLNLAKTALHSNAEDLDSLMETNFKDSTNKVKEVLTEQISKLGENIIIKRMQKFEDKEFSYQRYLHNSVDEHSGKIGVLLTYKCSKTSENIKEFSKNLCMHIAATDPKSLSEELLDKNLVEKERSIYSEQLKNSNKPDEIINKIIDGKIKKYFEEVCLTEQYFVMDNKIKIKDLISTFNKEHALDYKISNFLVYKLGQE